MALFRLAGIAFHGPEVEIDGVRHSEWVDQGDHFVSALSSDVRLEIERQDSAKTNFSRFRYRLIFPGVLTRSAPDFRLTYLSWSDAPKKVEQIELSHFDPVAHSYLPGRSNFAPEETPVGSRFPGPILRFGEDTLLQVAYEHGHDHPDSFLEFVRTDFGWKICERKTNYLAGTYGPWESIWFQIGHGPTERLPKNYRQFVLEDVCPTPSSRAPYLFYNTWNYQERLKYLHDQPYLGDMNLKRMLGEIDVAHRMGIDVFVIDTGWYAKTGDWEVDLDRFPDDLVEVKRALDERGMKLGLWFNPTMAARTSKAYSAHPEWQMTRAGQGRFDPVWETEESTSMCLVSDFAADYVETVVRLHRELGVAYLKWDAIGQYGCDSPVHQHGTSEQTAEERAQLYGFESGRRLQWIVEQVTTRCPGMIVDFDMTECGRYFGLGFLNVGKYFLVNNGPYFHDFDIPSSHKRNPETINVFFNPGPARPRVCRTGAAFDDVIPSILFLTHYLPDGPRLSQENSLASLALGGNGIWGDLLALTDEDVSWWGEHLRLYATVAEEMTRAFPRSRGFRGSSPEIVEKINPENGRGLVSFFTVKAGEYRHITAPLPGLPVVHGANEVRELEDGRLEIVVRLEQNGARMVVLA
ncbi:MAG: alpha-galactosidase [Fimbriimonas sp.]